MDRLNAFLSSLALLLTGEPARLIGYGAAIVIFLVAKFLQVLPDVSFEDALVQAVAALAMVAAFVESIRHYVYSPNTVSALLAAAQVNARNANPPV